MRRFFESWQVKITTTDLFIETFLSEVHRSKTYWITTAGICSFGVTKRYCLTGETRSKLITAASMAHQQCRTEFQYNPWNCSVNNVLSLNASKLQYYIFSTDNRSYCYIFLYSTDFGMRDITTLQLGLCSSKI